MTMPGGASVTARLQTLQEALGQVADGPQQAVHAAALLRQCADELLQLATPPEASSAAGVRRCDDERGVDTPVLSVQPGEGATIAKAAPAGRKIRKTKGRAFDAGKYRTRHVALEILYIGWNYHGFAMQESSKETVEVCAP
jgi:tRNA pseudouridine38/39 synthase